MKVTDVQIELVEPRGGEQVKAFCSITLDGEFVVRDIKVIEWANGTFVDMPSRKVADRCRSCGHKNHLRAKYCNECGARLDENRARRGPDGRARLHADVAHPINTGCRERLQTAILDRYYQALAKAQPADHKLVHANIRARQRPRANRRPLARENQAKGGAPTGRTDPGQ